MTRGNQSDARLSDFSPQFETPIKVKMVIHVRSFIWSLYLIIYLLIDMDFQIILKRLTQARDSRSHTFQHRGQRFVFVFIFSGFGFASHK